MTKRLHTPGKRNNSKNCNELFVEFLFENNFFCCLTSSYQVPRRPPVIQPQDKPDQMKRGIRAPPGNRIGIGPLSEPWLRVESLKSALKWNCFDVREYKFLHKMRQSQCVPVWKTSTTPSYCILSRTQLSVMNTPVRPTPALKKNHNACNQLHNLNICVQHVWIVLSLWPALMLVFK